MRITIDLDNDTSISIAKQPENILPTSEIETLDVLLNAAIKASGADKFLEVIKK